MMKKLNNIFYNLAQQVSDNNGLYDRVFYSLQEDGIDVKYGNFISKIHHNGFIKVMKGLGLYKVTGRAHNKTIFINEKLEYILHTTVANNKDVVDAILNPIRAKKFKIDSFEKYDALEESHIKPSKAGFLTYIIFNKQNALHKIGRSKNILKRLDTLRLEHGRHIELIAFHKSDIEGLLHFEHRNCRIFGEWFKLTMDEVLDICNEYKFVMS